MTQKSSGIKPFLTFTLVIIFLMGLFLLTSLSDKTVAFSDENLELAIRQHLNHFNKPIYQSQLLSIHELDLSDKAITDLSGIEHFRNLHTLNLAHNRIVDLRPLMTLYGLRSLDLQDNNITELDQIHMDAIIKLGLHELRLDNNRILTPQGVEVRISDISLLSNFQDLEALSLSENHISDITPLQGLSQLRELDLSDNRIKAISGPANWTKIETLGLAGNQIADLSFLNQMGTLGQLKTLDLSLNQIENLTPLASLSHLYNLVSLNLSRNQIQDIAPLAQFSHLKKLNLRQNNLDDLTPLSGLVQLTYLNIHSNFEIESVSPLASLVNLSVLIMRNVPIADQTWIFSEMPHLYRLNINNCGITDYSFLGELMAAGILQDNPSEGIVANVNIRANVYHPGEKDTLASLRPYWENITYRNPFLLPHPFEDIEPPLFSMPSGFYTDGFDLTLSAQNADYEIYYTLDGSDPNPVMTDTPKSPYQVTHLYHGPIPVQSRVGEANRFSAINTTHVENLIAWQPPTDEVFKATVIRAMVVDPERQTSSPIVTQTYFVDDKIDSRYSTIPVISLAADYEVLFAPESGILNTGIDSNPFYHLETRVPANIEILNPDTNLELNGLFEIKLHGNTSVANPQKGFHVFAEPWLGHNKIQYPLFQDSTTKANQLKSFDRLIIRGWGTAFNWTVFFSNAYHQTLMSHSSLDIQDYQPAILFINGEYWGIYEIREANKNVEYFQAHYFEGNTVVPIDILELGTVDFIEAGSPDQWLALVEFYENNDLSIPENYAFVQTKIDIENFVQYIIHCVFTGKKDWPTHNEAMWRSPALDGKWRWIQFDMDQGLRPWIDSHYDMVYHVMDGTFLGHPLLLALLQNEAFEIYFLNSFADMLNTVFLTSVEINHFNLMAEELEPYIPEYRERWQTGADWETDKAKALELIMNRWALRKNQLLMNFSIESVHEVRLISDQVMGTIQINSIQLDETTPGADDPSDWTGFYFDGIPITITALPNDGYRFVGWETESELDLSNPDLTITLYTDLRLKALFEKLN